MSLHVMSTAWKLPKLEGLKLSDKAVLLKLSDHADDTGGSCFPSIARIAEECWCSEKTVSRAISRLELMGIISKRKRKESTNIYSINVPALERLVAEKILKKPTVKLSPTLRSNCPVPTVKLSPTLRSNCPPNHQYNHQYNRQSSCKGHGAQQQPISESEFLDIRNAIRPDLPDVLKSGQSLYAKFTEMNVPATMTEHSARMFLQIERPEAKSAAQSARDRRKAVQKEEEALIEQSHQETGYAARTAAEAQSNLDRYRAGEIPHWKDTQKPAILPPADQFPDF